MLRTIILKEIREIAYSPKFAFSFGAMSVVILLAFYAGSLNYWNAQHEFEAHQADLQQRLSEASTWAKVTVPIYLEPSPLEAVVTGTMSDLARSQSVGMTYINVAPTTTRNSEDPIWALFPAIDLEFILTVVLSLFAILFAYDSVNGERERGTLALAMSNPVPRDTLLLGKVAGSFLALFVPLLIPMLIGTMILVAQGIPFAPEDWIGFLLIVLAGGLYLAVFLNLSVLVSSLTSRTSTAFLVLSVAWVVLVLVLPRASSFLAGRLVDVPTQATIGHELTEQFGTNWAKREDDVNSWSAGQSWEGVTREEYERRWTEFFGGVLADIHREQSDFAEKLMESVTNGQREQASVALRLARLSPTTSMRIAATTIAGTGVASSIRFKNDLRRYQTQLRFFVEQEEGVAAYARSQMAVDAPPVDASKMPRFVLAARDLSVRIEVSLWDFAFLFFHATLFFVLSILAFRRSDLRRPPE